jgi:hypothetical protein
MSGASVDGAAMDGAAMDGAVTDDGIGDLSATALIGAGGWNAKYARVLLIEQDGDLGLVLIDGNGDGAELELEYWQRDADRRWRGGSTSGHGQLDDLPSAQSWDAGDFVAALGRVRPSAEVSVEYGGRVYRRRGNEFGIWGFIHPADSTHPGEMPAVTMGEAPRS